MNSSKLFAYEPDCVTEIRKRHGIDKPERLNEALDILESWINEQNHFVKKDFSKEYLENALISSKGSIELTKMRLDKLCTYKTLLPAFFGAFSARELNLGPETEAVQFFLPKLTKAKQRVYGLKNMKKNIDSDFMIRYYKFAVSAMEYIRVNDYSDGFILIFDYRETNLKALISAISPVDVNNILQIIIEGFGARVHGIHFITPSKVIDVLVSIFKRFLSAKLSKRMHVHIDIDDLYNHLPIDMMPKEYGGKEKSMYEMNDDLLDELSTKEYVEYLDDISQAKTDESLRLAGKFNEQYIGMPGTFRTLSVD